MKYHEFNPVIYSEFLGQALEHYDFARCQRPDGSYYGTGGLCRKGTEVGAREKKTSRKSQVAKIKSLRDEGKALLEKGDKKGGLAKLNEAIKLQNELPSAPPKKAVSKSKRDELDEYWKEQAAKAENGVDKKIKEGSKTEMAPYARLSADEKASVQMYGQEGDRESIFREVNARLRSGTEPSSEKKAAADFTEKNLRSALDNLPSKEGTFYRAICCEGVSSFTNLKVGDTVEDKGFGSYADRGGPKISPFLDRKNENIVVIFRGRNLKNVSPIMQYQEGEHLSMPGTKMKLVDIQDEGFYHRKVGSVKTYVFEEV